MRVKGQDNDWARVGGEFPPFFSHPELIKWMEEYPELYGPAGGVPPEDEIAKGFGCRGLDARELKAIAFYENDLGQE